MYDNHFIKYINEISFKLMIDLPTDFYFAYDLSNMSNKNNIRKAIVVVKNLEVQACCTTCTFDN